jgi:prolyl oligopeptidase
VAQRNDAIGEELTRGTRFAGLRDEIKQVLDSTEKVAYPQLVGGMLENFWQDAEHPRGLWRRTTLEEYREPEPEWDVLVDIDALAEKRARVGSTRVPRCYGRAVTGLS